MNRRNRAFPTGVFISQRYNRQSGLCSGPDFWTKFVIQSLPFTIFLLIGAFGFTMFFNSQESGLSPESDWCCKEQRLKSERNIKNRRMISKIILAIIGFINLCLIVTTAYICIQRKNNARQGITRPNTGQAEGSTTQGGSGNVTTTTQYPSPYGFQQPAYGQTPEYPSGQDLILQHPLNIRLFRRVQLILHRLSTPIILHRMVHRHYLQQSCLHPHRMKVLLAKVTLLQVLPQRRKFVKKR